MVQVSGLRFKLVYSNWYYKDGRSFPMPNGLLPVTINYIKSLDDEHFISRHFRVPFLDERFQTSEIGNFYRHSNFIWHFCKRHSENNLVNEEQVIDDGSKYYFPVELERSGQHLLSNPKRFTIGDETYEYYFKDSLTPTILELIKSGKVTLLITNLVDASSSKSQIIEFERMINSLGVDSNNVVFAQGNRLNFSYEDNPSCRIKLVSGVLSLYQAVEQVNRYPFFSDELNYINDIVRPNDLDITKHRNKKFLCFNRSMNRPHRLAMAYLALKYKLLDDSIFSFVTNLEKNIERTLLQLCPYIENPSEVANQILNLVPYELDTQHLTSEHKQRFQTVGINKKDWYEDSYIHIVSESQFDFEIDPFFSEKTWRPIMNLQPFLFVGNCNSIAKLKKIGFKTFHPYIDETYDSEQDPKKRFKMIEEEIRKLSNKSLQEIHDWYYSITEILLYNQNHLMSFENYDPYEELYNGF